MQKPQLSARSHFWKMKKTNKIGIFFGNGTLQRAYVFFALQSVHQNASFRLSKNPWGGFFIFPHIMGGGPFFRPQVLRCPLESNKAIWIILFWKSQDPGSTEMHIRTTLVHFHSTWFTFTQLNLLKGMVHLKNYLASKCPKCLFISRDLFLQEFHAYIMHTKGILFDKFCPWSVPRM